jgi:hypothetical protein
MIRKMLLTSAATVMMLTLSVIAQADSITVANKTPTVTATITNFSLVGNQFCFTINNTSTTGSITALGFDLPGTNRGSFSIVSRTNSNFTLESGTTVQAGAQTNSRQLRLRTSDWQQLWRRRGFRRYSGRAKRHFLRDG